MVNPRNAKDVTELLPLRGAYETPMAKMTDYITPTASFFICSAGETPTVKLNQWRLELEGDAINAPLSLDYDALRKMPQITLSALLECAGNHRSLFDKAQGQPLNKRPHLTEVMWGLGGVGMAEWTGVRLKDVLALAGVANDAYHVCPEGLDRGIEGAAGIRCPMPIEKAMDKHTIIAFEMNGKPLLPEHGYPARMIVPGWVGAYSIKWLSRISVTSAHQWVHRNTQLYVMMGKGWPAEQFKPANGAAVTEQSLKSSLALNWPARLNPGTHKITGYARSPNAKISSVQWSDDFAQTWKNADIISPNCQYGWAMFEFYWVAIPGKQTLMTRTMDENGSTQPDKVPFNSGGYLFNAIHPHPVIVSQE
jgi:DMSO/TMAO reductase YedYZ molybdopterin-dependent catalytic subunit